MPVINSSTAVPRPCAMYRTWLHLAVTPICAITAMWETGGTSYSSPLWAGFIALVNQQAVENGQPTLGFLNPIIYEIGQGANYNNDFHDMIGGNDDCCGQPVYYNAVAGYDLVTGWELRTTNLIDDLLATTATPSYTLMASPATLSISRSDSGSINMLVGASADSRATNLGRLRPAQRRDRIVRHEPHHRNPRADADLEQHGHNRNSPVTITGTFGRLSASTTMTLTVTTTPRTSPSATGSPTFANVGISGHDRPTRFTVTGVDNFSSAVALSARTCPSAWRRRSRPAR